MTIFIIAPVEGECVVSFWITDFRRESHHSWQFQGKTRQSRVFSDEEAFRIVDIAIVAPRLCEIIRDGTREWGTAVQSDAQRKPIKIARRAFY